MSRPQSLYSSCKSLVLYLSELCTRCSDLRLRSSTRGDFAIRRTSTRIARWMLQGLHTWIPWNSLPVYIRNFNSLVTAVCNCKAGECSVSNAEAEKSLVNAFISNRLDYCNSLLYGIADTQLQRRQSVQNAAARLVTGTRRSQHITPVLRSLPWLPVRQRITFKVATTVHKWLNGRAPVYLSNDLLQYAGQRRTGMRSALLEVPRSQTTIGDRSFSIAGPRVRNTLPASVSDINSSLRFRKLLKVFLFV